MIDFALARREKSPNTDWVFFSSKNAVKSFFKLGYNIDNKQLGCIGKGTAKELFSYVNHVDFVGDNVDIKTTALEFSEILGNDTCLFPISNISKRTVQKACKNKHQAFDLIVYETKVKDAISAATADVMIFTSPSNVKSYFSKYKIASGLKIIAMGPSTGKALAMNGVNDYHLPQSLGELGIIDTLYKL